MGFIEHSHIGMIVQCGGQQLGTASAGSYYAEFHQGTMASLRVKYSMRDYLALNREGIVL